MRREAGGSAVEVREVRPGEEEAAGRATVAGWRPLAEPGDAGWERYLAEIGDVASRARVATVLVAVGDGRVLGSATVDFTGALEDVASIRPGAVILRMLGVHPAAQGRGVGRALVTACLDAARRSGRTVALLHTSPRMVTARHLYESMGFERDPERDHHGEDGFTLLAYRMPLRT